MKIKLTSIVQISANNSGGYSPYWPIRGGSAQKEVSFSGFRFMKRVGITLVEVFEMEGKSVPCISVGEKAYNG